MFREMRRKQKAIGGDEIQKLLTEERRAVLAVNGDDGYPYAVPVNYYFDPNERKIYFHSSRVGHKADALNRCDKVCFTVFGNETVRDEVWAPYLQSVIVFGRCRPMEDPSEAAVMLRRFAGKYYPDEATVDEEITRSGKAVRMYEIEIEHISGKTVQER